ncbi:Uncharacterized protein TPAR_02286 [Tolypocladium paradoxum]|uniref:Trans-sialidase-like protein n=1 Tax=Tolypocladium paradoxum TaxID=94208 RepID=A0A2S4L4X4_9HYPO|nr:Uncharacterized protein TPAR_02286 [Tolypocladium paradoxum]
MSAPPPPPPHGEVPKSSGLPPGKYDIFVIPEHSAGSGFLYLPSLQPNVNSFAAGFASALILVALFQSMAPAFRVWWEGFQGLGNMGITLLIFGVGFGAWALGRTQKEAPAPGHGASTSSGGRGQGGGFGGASTSGPPPNASGPPPPPHGNAPPPPPPPGGGAPPPPQPEKPKASWQRPPPQPGTTRPETPKGSWEKAREETRRKEEERKAKEAEQKRREEAAKRLAELRAKEARERQQREREKEHKEKEAKEQKERDLAEKRNKDAAEKQEREKREREAKEREAREREAKERETKEREAKERETKEREAKQREEQKKKEATATNRVGSSYAYSGVGEKTSMWPNGRPAVPPSEAGSASKNTAKPDRQPPPPTARTCVSTDEDGFSFRPYDKPRKPRRRPSVASIGDSESSWAPSHTTARTSPPPSVRGPYSTKDPDKIVIQAVYLFMNQFAKTPASQLVSGVGSVTDGLILRITTEGLFIDDDVRGVPQREWDVKAWTLKLVEVWCPPHCLNSAAAASASNPAAGAKSPPHLLYKMATARRNADRDAAKTLTGDDADVYLTDMLRACKDCCRLGLCDRTFKNTNIQSPSGQTGEWRAKGLHVLRATIRDQESKRYMFVLDETEGWKVAVGLQRLRRGTQVRQLGVSGMTPSEARGTLEMLGWAG